MAKKSKRKMSGGSTGKDSPSKKGAGKLLEEIIRESLDPDCNLILLDGKIRELEDSGKNYMPLLLKAIREGKVSEQKVVFDLLARKKTKEAVKNLREVVREDLVSIRIRKQAVVQLAKWGESVDEALLTYLEKGEELIFSIEKVAELKGVKEEEVALSLTEKFHKLPRSLKISITKQILDEYPKSSSLIVKLIQGEDDLDEKIVEMLAESVTVEVGDLFAKALVETKNKNLRRLLKKHLFRMKNKGLNVVIPEIEDEKSPKYLKIEPSRACAYVTGIDYLGERLVFVSKSILGWGVVFFQITLSDQEGLKNFSAFDLKRKEVKNFLTRISKDGLIQLTDVDPDYCYYLIDEACQISLKKGLALPEQFSHWKAEIDDLKGKIAESAIYSFIAKEEFHKEGIDSLRGRYASLFELDELKNWVLEPRLIWSYIEEYKEAETSPLVLKPYQVEDRKESVLKRAAKEIFGDDFRKTYQRRLEETAYLLFRKTEKEAAMVTLSAAEDLKPEGIQSEKHGFLQGLMQRSILFYVQEKDLPQEDASIIVPR